MRYASPFARLAEALRVHGEILLAHGAAHEGEAETAFRRAMDVARAQRARSWELRAVTSLAGLLVWTGRKPEARRVLSDVLFGFTEGSDTADQRAARALIATL